ncbi:ATP synthase B/B' CF family protein [Mycobacterium ulcerans str. Harvey]|uniref:ATP synthase B/B' CF family protein n=1 Tax=Mycobacterium ulcerans str. Harvey TaxID=1299332 RepID=A0ABN0R9L9_MYCUL|nr:ATP synthase B/B' CF family protein [Mycobacterium ulcerans str. Harvey]
MDDVNSIVLAAARQQRKAAQTTSSFPTGRFSRAGHLLGGACGHRQFVVPPILKVLRERDAMVAMTLADNKKSAEQFAAAQADYEKAMAEARVQASSYRHNARAEGRKVVEDARAHAEQEVASTLQQANEQLKRERDAVELDLRANVERCRRRCQPDRRCRRDYPSRGGVANHVDIHRTVVGFAAIVFLVWRYVVPPVRRMMAARQDTVRQQLADAGYRRVRSRSRPPRTVRRGGRQGGGGAGRRRGKEDAKRITAQMQTQAGSKPNGSSPRVSSGRAAPDSADPSAAIGAGPRISPQASELVRNHVSDPGQQAATVDASSTSSTRWRRQRRKSSVRWRPDAVGQPAGAGQLGRQVRRFGQGPGQCGAFGSRQRLVSVAQLLQREVIVTRYLTVPAEDAAPRIRLLERLISGQVGNPRWISCERRHGAVVGKLGSDRRDRARVAAGPTGSRQRDGQVDEVEDQLFRFSRIWTRNAPFHPARRLCGSGRDTCSIASIRSELADHRSVTAARRISSAGLPTWPDISRSNSRILGAASSAGTVR